MPVRDDVIFCPGSPGQRTFGEIRKLNQQLQIDALKRRLDSFLIDQINQLGIDNANEKKVYSPYPLFLLTLVAMETLGKALFKPKTSSEEDAQKYGFLEVAKRIDAKLSKPLNKCEKKDYDLLWGEGQNKKINSKAEILYRFGRHTMAHGYRGKGIYISEIEEINIWRVCKGAIELNPYKFWIEYRRVYEEAWSELSEEKEPTSPRKRSAIEFLSELLIH